MITKTQSFKTSDAQIHPSFESAQKHELECLIASYEIIDQPNTVILAEKLIEGKSELVEILSAKPRKPRTVKAKKAKAKPEA